MAIECESISDIAVLKAGHPGSCLIICLLCGVCMFCVGCLVGFLVSFFSF